jgi:hypothetical protein
VWITLLFAVVFAALLIWQRRRLNRSTAVFDPEADYKPPSSTETSGTPENGSAP